VDLRYWYPDVPPVPILLPIIRWTIIKWLSAKQEQQCLTNTPPIGPQCVHVNPAIKSSDLCRFGDSGYWHVYPGRLNIWSPVISFWMVQYTFEKCAETPSRSAIDYCSNISNLKEDILYNLLVVIGQWYNKDVNDGLILSNRNKRSDSVRTIEELSLELVLHTCKRLQ